MTMSPLPNGARIGSEPPTNLHCISARKLMVHLLTVGVVKYKLQYIKAPLQYFLSFVFIYIFLYIYSYPLIICYSTFLFCFLGNCTEEAGSETLCQSVLLPDI